MTASAVPWSCSIETGRVGLQREGSAQVAPAKLTTAAIWRAKNGCTGSAAAGRLDLASAVVGDETTVERASGCVAGGAVELMTIHGAGHAPPLAQPAFRETVWAFFAAHPRS